MNREELEKLYSNHQFEHIGGVKRRKSAIMIPIVENEDGKPAVLFEIRNRNIRQGGDVCFPGGRVDKGETVEEAVVREVCEELCLEREQVSVTAPLFTMDGVGGAFVSCFLGTIDHYTGSFSESEVEQVFTISIEDLLAMKPKINDAQYVIELPEDFHYELIPGGRDYKWIGRPKHYYFYETEYAIIWGMTAEFLYNFVESVRELNI